MLVHYVAPGPHAELETDLTSSRADQCIPRDRVEWTSTFSPNQRIKQVFMSCAGD